VAELSRRVRGKVDSDETAEIFELAIESLGASGDGIARHGGATIYLPFTAPGDRLTARRIGRDHARAIEWRAYGPDRQTPPCPHFGACGGCALQHLSDAAYGAWKTDIARTALARRGFRELPIAALVRTPPATRRRAEFVSVRHGRTVALGFHAPASSEVIPIQTCLVLAPALVALLAPLRGLLADILGEGERLDVHVNLTQSGIDVLMTAVRALDLGGRERLAAFASDAHLARLCWRPGPRVAADPVTLAARPRMTFGGVGVDLPPGAFLQASAAGETAIIGEVLAAASGCRRIGDLYSGCGTLSFPLARNARVHAIESERAMVDALTTAAGRARLDGQITAETRDLARLPLSPEELAPFDAVVFDPPREGARAQSEMLARSRVPLVVGVSCNPGTFARDARLLVEGGYRLERLLPIDQFLWSPHLELVGVFRRTA